MIVVEILDDSPGLLIGSRWAKSDAFKGVVSLPALSLMRGVLYFLIKQFLPRLSLSDPALNLNILSTTDLLSPE